MARLPPQEALAFLAKRGCLVFYRYRAVTILIESLFIIIVFLEEAKWARLL